MDLTPREKDKLLIFTAGLLAERRLARGLKLNYPEAVALISAAIMEGARDGKSVAQLMSEGATILTRADVMEGIPAMSPGSSRYSPGIMAPLMESDGGRSPACCRPGKWPRPGGDRKVFGFNGLVMGDLPPKGS